MELSYINICEPLLLRPLELPCSFPDLLINNAFDSKDPHSQFPKPVVLVSFQCQFLILLMKKTLTKINRVKRDEAGGVYRFSQHGPVYA